MENNISLNIKPGRFFKGKRQKLWFILLCAGVVLWVCFIWSNSIKPAVQSSQASGGIVQLLAGWFGFDLSGPVYELVTFWVRKSAHFLEYAVLGVLLWCSILTWGKAGSRQLKEYIFTKIPLGLLLGVLTAMADESIQLFSEGRSCEVRDVWIDLGGTAFGIALVLLVQGIGFLIKKKRRAKG